MTDDERLVALFRDAADDAPPPGFDHADVVAASRRATVRRRSALAGGALALLAVFGLAGLAGTAGGSGGSGGDIRTAAGPLAAPEAAYDGGGPLGPGQRECADRQDPALRAYLEQALPEVVGAPEAAITMECRPGGERGVNLEVDDAGRRGVLTVSYLPPGATLPPVPSGPTTAAGIAPTASGGTVLVLTRSNGGGPPPFADRVDRVVTSLAPRL